MGRRRREPLIERPVTLTPEAVEALGVRRLAEILLDHAEMDERLAQTLCLVVAKEGGEALLVRALSVEIDRIIQDDQFIGYREGGAYAADLDRVRTSIVEDLLPDDPWGAAELLGRFIRLDRRLMERADDSDGAIGDVLKQAVRDYGQAWASAPDRDRAGLAAEVFAILTKNDYGVHGDIVVAFSAALEAEGLGELERLIRCELDRRRAKDENAQEWELARGLKDIADARGDVDGYIAAQRVAGHEDMALADIVRRLLDAGRLDEALTRIETTDVPDHRRYGIVPLFIETLERLGRMEDAQRVRWREFERTLGRGMLDDYLSGLPEEKRAVVIAKAVDVAVRHPAVHSALPLLIDLDRVAAAHLVLDRFAALSGGLYTTLRPAAQALEADHPLPASCSTVAWRMPFWRRRNRPPTTTRSVTLLPPNAWPHSSPIGKVTRPMTIIAARSPTGIARNRRCGN